MQRDDQRYMKRALRLARQGAGRVSPNPMVGCVIVKSDKVVAQGYHHFCGGDHAEVDALKKAGVNARGAIMYVTLEPCSHWGRTPPCVDAILKAGIAKVVVAMADPDPRNNGRAFDLLRDQGVAVIVGVCEEAARELNEAFIKRISTGLPLVTVKTAQTMDGRIATRTGESKWITSEEARVFSRSRRDHFDAIMVGVGTVVADDPLLDAPLKKLRKVVVDPRARMSTKAKIVQNAEPEQVVVAVGPKVSRLKIRRLEDAGVRVEVCSERQGVLDLKVLLKRLAKNDVQSLLVEGGAILIGTMLKAKLVDRLNIYLAPKLLGDQKALGSVVGLDIARLSKAVEFRVRDVQRVGTDVFIEAVVKE